MTEEKELLIAKCLKNPVLKAVAASVTSASGSTEQFTLPMPKLERSTGLSVGSIKKGIEWLIRKGFIRCNIDGPYPQRGAHYSLDPDLRKAFAASTPQPFGKWRNTAGKFVVREHVQLNVISHTSTGWIGDEWNIPLSLEIATTFRDALVSYVRRVEEMGESAFEAHRESRANLGRWTGGQISRPPMISCGCAQCISDYDAMLTSWTNYKSAQKQERRTIQMALAEFS